MAMLSNVDFLLRNKIINLESGFSNVQRVKKLSELKDSFILTALFQSQFSSQLKPELTIFSVQTTNPAHPTGNSTLPNVAQNY